MLKPGPVKAAVEQFLADGGISLYETSSLAAFHLEAAKWAGLLENHYRARHRR
jgi:hypothetical protein